MKKEHNIEDYEKEWNKIFKQLFDKEDFNYLNNTKIKAFKFNCINNTYPKDYLSLKELFSSQENIDYFTERGHKPLSFLFMAAFYYGMQASYDWKVKPLQERVELHGGLIKKIIDMEREKGTEIKI